MINFFKKHENLFSLILCFCIIVFSEAFFFRNILGNSMLIGDRGDGRLTTLLAEHWWNFFNGYEKFDEIAMFYPAKGVMGYTDLFFGFGLIHSLFRFLGIDMFIAYKWTLIFVHFIGTLSTFLLCSKGLKIGKLASLFATIAFSFSNAYAIHIGHTQLVAISVLPLLTFFVVEYVQNLKNIFRRNVFAFLAMLSFLFIIYNSWYVAYFVFLFSLIFCIVFCSFSRCFPGCISGIFKAFKKVWKEYIFYFLFFCCMLIPFFLIYLPAYRETSGYSYSEAYYYTPEMIDLINVDTSNFLLGDFIGYLDLASRHVSGEYLIGFSIILLGLFLWSVIMLKRKIKSDKNMSSYVFCSVVITILVLSLFSIKFSIIHFSLWKVIFYLVPGGGSIRAIARIQFFLSFPMAIIVAYWLNSLIKEKKLKKMIMILLILLLWISNVNMNGVSAGWDSENEKKFIASVKVPPEGIKSFYISDFSKKKTDPDYIYNLDAFEIANNFHIKTLNGYSGKNPLNWELYNMKNSIFYQKKVQNWISENLLEGVFLYDRFSNTWVNYSKIKNKVENYKLGTKISFGKNGQSINYIQKGFSNTEEQHTWTVGDVAILEFYVPEIPNNDLILKFKGWPFLARNLKHQKISILCNDILLKTLEINKLGEYSVKIPLKYIKNNLLKISFNISNPTSPLESGQSTDNRKLGFAFLDLTLEKEGK